MAPTKEERYLGCVLGGACGDALGAPVEFLNPFQIFSAYGPAGIRDLQVWRNVDGAFTDDTQMTLFTIEGLISFILSLGALGEISRFDAEKAIPNLYQSYLRWLHTQEYLSVSPIFKDVKEHGMLIKCKQLHNRRAPGRTCVGSLASGSIGSKHNRINDSKGCGGVMRVAPCGLIVQAATPNLSYSEQMELAFNLGCVAAAVTHTHPTGWLASGCLSSLIHQIIQGSSLKDAIQGTISLLEKEDGHIETLNKIQQAWTLSENFIEKLVSGIDQISEREIILKHIKEIGGGWIAEEALGIALFCSLVSDRDCEKAICYSVNHGGDSDSTGAITGNIMGALLGEAAIPKRWRDKVELADLLKESCLDLLNVTDASKCESLCAKYPLPIQMHQTGILDHNSQNKSVKVLKVPSTWYT